MKAEPNPKAFGRREAGSARIARYQAENNGRARVVGQPWPRVLAFFHYFDGSALDVIEFLRRGDYLNHRSAFVQLENAFAPAILEMAGAIARLATASLS
jgi:hypothetical protein